MTLPKKSTIIFASLVPVALIFVGGLILSYFERPNEIESALQFETLKHDYLEAAHHFETNDDFSREFLENYIHLTKVFTKKDLDNVTGDIKNPHWHLRGAALFCLTLMSTIGYGVYTPQTNEGKLFCCIFTMIAIPFFLFWIATYGKIIKHFFEKLSSEIFTVCRSLFSYTGLKAVFKTQAAYSSAKDFIVVVLGVLFLVAGGILFDFTHLKDSAIDTLYFNVITLATVGLGDFAPDVNSSSLIMQIGYGVYVVLGLSTLSMLHQVITEHIAQGKQNRAQANDKMDCLGMMSMTESTGTKIQRIEEGESSSLLSYGSTSENETADHA